MRFLHRGYTVRPRKTRSPVAAASLAAGAWLIGCSAPGSANLGSSAEIRPAWIDRPAEALPGGSFMTAVGVGADRPAAVDAAYARLAQRLRVDVAATERLVDRYAQRLNNGREADSEQTVSLLRVIETQTHEQLPGAQIAATYEDRRRGEHYALAALDRRRAAEAMRSQVRRNIDLAEHRRALARDESSPLRAHAALRRARVAARAAQRIARARAVVSPARTDSGAQQRAESLLAGIERRLSELKNDVGVVLEAAGAPARLRRVVRDAAQELDLPVSLRGSAAARLRVEYEASEAVSHARERRIVRWTLRLDAIDAQRLRALDSLSLAGAVEARNLSAARSEALAEAQRALERDAKAFLDEALLGG